jgi:hypothetical protein
MLYLAPRTALSSGPCRRCGALRTKPARYCLRSCWPPQPPQTVATRLPVAGAHLRGGCNARRPHARIARAAGLIMAAGGHAGPSRAVFGGMPADDGWGVDDDRQIADLVADYGLACVQSRAIAARLVLDDTVSHPRLGQISLRWVLVHMIEETARHAGHADILREQTDGATGFDG